MRSRFEDKLECQVAACPELAQALVPQLILQPLVENALRYAADPDTGHIVVAVKIRRGGERLYLEICDRGPATGSPDQPGRGVGLKNLESRLERLYGSAGQLRIEHNPGHGTSVRVELPYHTDL